MTLKFTIYRATNQTNGKSYVGQTRYDIADRRGRHVYDAINNINACRAFHGAIRKYGPAAFVWETLQVVYSREEANAIEAEWIKKLECRVPNGYNLAPGGLYSDMHKETRALVSNAVAARWANMSLQEKKIVSAKIGARIAKAHANWTKEERKALGSDSVKRGWAAMAPEARQARAENNRTVLQAARDNMSMETKKKQALAVSNASRLWWANATLETREARAAKIWETKLSRRLAAAWLDEDFQ